MLAKAKEERFTNVIVRGLQVFLICMLLPVPLGHTRAQGQYSSIAVPLSGRFAETSASPANPNSLDVSLTIQEAIYSGVSGRSRSQDPVSVGVPLPDLGDIRSISQLGLRGASVGQFRILGRWPSGNIKWLLIDTQADVAAGQTNNGISLVSGTGNFGGGDLASEDSATITINTGPAVFTIRKANFNLIDKAVVNGKILVVSDANAGLVVLGPAPGSTTCPCSTTYSSANDPAATAVIEENGPARAVIKATGQHLLGDAKGEAFDGVEGRMRRQR